MDRDSDVSGKEGLVRIEGAGGRVYWRVVYDASQRVLQLFDGVRDYKQAAMVSHLSLLPSLPPSLSLHLSLPPPLSNCLNKVCIVLIRVHMSLLCWL